jgi:hypothetical protein
VSQWTVYSVCALCAARTSKHTGDDREQLHNECDIEARAMGWRLLPERKSNQGPRRHEMWICADCLRDIRAAAPPGQTLALPGVG